MNAMRNNAPLVQVIAKAWSDPDFKQALIDNPKETLAGQGIELPEDKTIKVHEDNADVLNLVIPTRPEELKDSQLENASGGVATYGCDWRFTW